MGRRCLRYTACLSFYKKLRQAVWRRQRLPSDDAGTAEEQEQQQQLEGLLASAAKMLPAAQQGLATTPQQSPGPDLALTGGPAAGQVSFIGLQLALHSHSSSNSSC